MSYEKLSKQDKARLKSTVDAVRQTLGLISEVLEDDAKADDFKTKWGLDPWQALANTAAVLTVAIHQNK